MAYQGKNEVSCSREQELISDTKNEQVQSAGKKLRTKGNKHLNYSASSSLKVGKAQEFTLISVSDPG